MNTVKCDIANPIVPGLVGIWFGDLLIGHFTYDAKDPCNTVKIQMSFPVVPRIMIEAAECVQSAVYNLE